MTHHSHRKSFSARVWLREHEQENKLHTVELHKAQKDKEEQNKLPE